MWPPNFTVSIRGASGVNCTLELVAEMVPLMLGEADPATLLAAGYTWPPGM